VGIVGWVSGLLLAGCMLPQAAKVVREGNARGTSWGMLLAWFAGEVLGVIYLTSFVVTPWPVLANYATNAALAILILCYKVLDVRRLPTV